MNKRTYVVILTVVFSFFVNLSAFAAPHSYRYWRKGNRNDIVTKTAAGTSLMGGGDHQAEAFKFLCDRSGGGDFVILRATGDDSYNKYVSSLCKQNSVTTIVIPDLAAAKDPFVAAQILKAEALFISGGDQSNYVKYWEHTPVQDAINTLIRKGVPVGGTSAGLAVLGEYNYSALYDSAKSDETLSDPYNKQVTLDHNFVTIPHLENTITDTHFVKRDRQGRLLGFMARLMVENHLSEIRAIAVDETSAALMEPDGKLRIVGVGKGAYFYKATEAPQQCKPGQSLEFQNISVYRIPTGGSFDLTTWTGTGGVADELKTTHGSVVAKSGVLY